MVGRAARLLRELLHQLHVFWTSPLCRRRVDLQRVHWQTFEKKEAGARSGRAASLRVIRRRSSLDFR